MRSTFSETFECTEVLPISISRNENTYSHPPIMSQGSRGECQKMLEVVSKNNIKVKTNAFNGIKEVPKAVELARSGNMQGKLVVIIDIEAIENEKSGLKMV